MKTLRTRPALRYHGGKWVLAPWVISYFPEHKIYTEAYGGAASVLLRKQPSYSEIYNDLDGEIVNVFKVIRDNGDDFRRRIYLVPFSRIEFLKAYENTDDPIERAIRTVVKSFMGFGSDGIKNKTGFRANSNRSGSTPAHDWANWPDQIPFFIERLKSVVIEQRPAIDILFQHDSTSTLHYIDPPYVHSTRSASKPKQYRHEMSDADHRELSDVIKSLKGKVVLSGYDCPLYQSLYSNFRFVSRDALADGARKRTETLWFNF